MSGGGGRACGSGWSVWGGLDHVLFVEHVGFV